MGIKFIILLLVTIQAACAQQPAVNTKMTIAPVVIPGDRAGVCPSEQERQNAHQNITSEVHSMLSVIEQCGEGVWYQLASVNMSVTMSHCPGGWVEENEGGVRACGRGTVGAGCKSALFSSGERDYTKVCGRAIGYQYSTPDAFGHRASNIPIDQNYVDGLSITYGSPRQHLWTYAASVREGYNSNDDTSSYCPCTPNFPGASPPPYVGSNWYCESGNPSLNEPVTSGVYADDPLWDGLNCEGTCCSNGKTPPWFSVELPGPTGEDIEARICADQHSNSNEDVFISIFIQ